MARRRWERVSDGRVGAQIDAIPVPSIRGAMATAIRNLTRSSCPAESIELDAEVYPKVRRLKIENWRALYVAFPRARFIYVGDVVIRHPETTYAEERILRVAREAKEARRRRNPAALDQRVRTALETHPEWGDLRVAEASGCSPAAVRARRLAWGLPARHALAWAPWR